MTLCQYYDMKSETEKEQTLRERQKATTRSEIVATAMESLRASGNLSHEAIAARAGMSARTVYRHFPSRDDLIAAVWERLRMETDTQFPQSEDEILQLAPRTFRNFDRNENLVRAFLFSGVGAEVRDRGAREGRPAFEAALRGLIGHLPARRQKQAVAVFLALYSAPAWQMMRDRGGISGEESAQAVTWALSALVEALRSEAKSTSKGQKNGNDRHTGSPARHA